MKNFSVKKILACTLLVVALFGLCFFAVRREDKPTLAFTDFRQVASLTDKVSTVWWSDNLLLQLSKSGELFSTDLRAKTSTLLIENASLFTANAYEVMQSSYCYERRTYLFAGADSRRIFV